VKNVYKATKVAYEASTGEILLNKLQSTGDLLQCTVIGARQQQQRKWLLVDKILIAVSYSSVAGAATMAVAG